MVYVSGRWVRVPVSGNTGVPGASSCPAITASPCGLAPKTVHVSSRRIDKVFHLSNCPMSTRIENRQNDREIVGDCQEKDRSLSHLYMHGAQELVRRLCCRQGSQNGIIIKRRGERWHGRLYRYGPRPSHRTRLRAARGSEGSTKILESDKNERWSYQRDQRQRASCGLDTCWCQGLAQGWPYGAGASRGRTWFRLL